MIPCRIPLHSQTELFPAVHTLDGPADKNKSAKNEPAVMTSNPIVPDPNRYTPMLKKSRYIALFSIFLLIGCRDNPNKHQNHFKEYDITCRSYETELYGRFPYLLTVDSLLISVAAEGSGGRIGRIYSIDDKPQEIGAFGRIGRGPLEFVHPEPDCSSRYPVSDPEPQLPRSGYDGDCENARFHSRRRDRPHEIQAGTT